MQPQDIQRDAFEKQPDGHYAERVAVVPAQYTENKFKNLNSAGTVNIKTGKGKLIGLVINKAESLSVTTLYDGVDATGTRIGRITNPLTLLNSVFNANYNTDFTNGLTIVTSGGDDITVVYR